MALHSRTAAVLAVVLAAGSAVSVAKGQAWANPVDGSWFDPLKWNPQSVPSGSGATAVLGLSGPYTVTTTSNTLLGVNITNPGATLAIQASQILTLGAANNTLNGVLIVNPTGAYVGTALDLGAGAVSFSGTGSVRLNASTSDPNTTAGTSRIVASGGSLTLGAGTRLEGFGMLQAVGSTNNGTFTANVPGRLLRIEGAAHQNNGLYTAANGGTLLVNGATVNQSPGASMAPGDGSWVQLLNSTVNGGSLVSTATARTQIAGGTLNGVVVTGGVDHHSNTTVGLGAAGLTLAGGATYAVNVEGAYAGTWLRADNASTPISGAGTVRLNASTSDPNTTAATAAVGLGGQFGSLIFSSGVSLAGFGMLQSIPTVNNGVFNADVNGRPLRIEGGSHQNNNLYTATAGGVLVINGAAVTQSPGAVISASGAGDNPSAVLLYSSSVTGGSIVSNGAAHAGLGGSTSGTLSGVTLTGQFDQLPSSTLYVSAPGITINGGATLLVNSSASYAGTWLRTGDAVTIGGSGTVRLNASSSDPNTTSATAALGEDGDPAGGVFTFGPGVTLAGFGMVSGVPTVNNGVFNADVSGRPLRLEGSSHQNNAQYRSSGGGQLLLSSTTVNQAGGASMLAGNGSDVAIVASTVSGGTIGSMAGTDGTTHVTSSSVTLQGVTVSRQLSVDGNGAASIAGSMTLSNNAVVTVNTSATYQGTSLRAAGTPAVINGTGTVRLNASTSDPNTTANTALLAQDTSVPTGSFSFGPGVTVDGFGRIGDVPTVNAGRVSANVPGRVLRIDGVSHQNNGRYDSANGGVLQIVSTTLTQGGSGTVVAGDGSSVQFSGATLQGGTLTGEGSGVSTVTGSSTFGGNVTIGGPVSVAPSQVLTVAATGITNNSVVTVNTNGSYAGTSVQAGGLNSPINGTGEVRLNRSSSDPQATVGTADLRGLTGTSLVFGPGQRLSGSGRVAVDTTIDGTVSPGYPAGAVDFIRNEGVMTFTANGGVTVDITGPGTFDRVVNAGTMSVRGTLVVNTTQDLDAGMTFDIVTGGTVTGRFDQVIGNGLTSPKRFGARVDPGRVRVTVLCGLADIGGAGADANGDGALNNNDFIVFIDRFFNQDPLVDFGRAGGQQGSDGVFDNNDFIAFIDLFFAGCF